MLCLPHNYTYMLMRDEKEGRKKQARSNKQQSKATQHTQVYMVSHVFSTLPVVYNIYSAISYYRHDYVLPLRQLNGFVE